MTINQFVCSSAHYFQYFLDAPVPQPPSVTLYQLGCFLVPGIIHDSHVAWDGVLIPKWVFCDPALDLHLSCGLSWSQLDSLGSRHWDRAAKNFCGRKMKEKDYEPWCWSGEISVRPRGSLDLLESFRVGQKQLGLYTSALLCHCLGSSWKVWLLLKSGQLTTVLKLSPVWERIWGTQSHFCTRLQWI